MGEDNFWLGVGAGMAGTSLLLYGAWKLHAASHERGWNGEELKSKGLFGIFGWTRSGALVLVRSFNEGKHDREVKLSLNVQTSRIDSLHTQTRNIIDQLNKLEQEENKKRPEFSPEEKKFLRDLHNIAKTRLVQPQPNSRQRKFYVT